VTQRNFLTHTKPGWRCALLLACCWWGASFAHATVLPPMPDPDPVPVRVHVRSHAHGRARHSAKPVVVQPAPVVVAPVEQKSTAAAADTDDVFATPPIASLIGAISPTHEPYLLSYLPQIPYQLAPLPPEFSWDDIGFPTLRAWSFVVEPAVAQQYREIAEAIAKDTTTDSEHAMEKKFLVSDLWFALALSGEKKYLTLARDAYEQALDAFPSSPHALRASYNLGVAFLLLQQYRECTALANRQESRWLKDPKWAGLFRSIAMEAYFMRARFVRAEDYLWDLAHRMDRSELSSQLALRYGDSQFWQRHFPEAIEWYETMHDFLDAAAVDAAKSSRLYYAESLFQVGRIADAAKQYAFVTNAGVKEFPDAFIKYRLLECQLVAGMDHEKALWELTSFMNQIRDDATKLLIYSAAQVQRARVIAQGTDTAFYTKAWAEMDELVRAPLVEMLHREARFMEGILHWRLGETTATMRVMKSLVPTLLAERRSDVLAHAASDVIVLMLLDAVPKYWQSKSQGEFLVVCDRYKNAIELTQFKAPMLVYIGHAYLESNMLAAGARLYQRMLSDLDLLRAQKERIILELARAYGAMKENDLLGKTLSLLSQEPIDAKNRHLYFLVKSVYAVGQGHFDECADDFGQLLKEGVHGNEVFSFALQGARCARRAKKYEQADQFIAMTGIKDAVPANSLSTSIEIQQWQDQAVFEKIALMASFEKVDEASALFEQMQTAKASVVPPLETVFLMMRAYRGLHQPDKALGLWKMYSDAFKTIPADRHDQYTQVLELLGRSELVPTGGAKEAAP